MNSLMIHGNEAKLVKRLGLTAKDLRQEVDPKGGYYLVARIETSDISIILFSDFYKEPIVIEED